jgi:hypothetical protein
MNTRTQTAATETALAIGSRRRADGGVSRLQLPAVDEGLRYSGRYWAATLRNLLREHRLHTGRVGRYAAPVHISERLLRRWHALFGTDATTPVPFILCQSVGTLLYTRLFADLGFNFRHLLHLQHTTTHVASPADCARSRRQELVCSLQGAWCLNGGKALIAVRTEIRRPADEGGALLALQDDRFVIRSLPSTDLAVLGCDLQALVELQNLRERRAQIDPDMPGAQVLALPLAADLGRRYGRVSGDYNPVHTGSLLARLFGVRRPFLQGLGLRNAVVRELTALGLPLDRLQISFASPAYLGQTLRLVVLGTRFELVDEKGRVVACGQVSHAPA